MRLPVKAGIIVTLCVLAGGGGHELRRRTQGTDLSQRAADPPAAAVGSRPRLPAAEPDEPKITGAANDDPHRQVLRHCTTEQLWEWLKSTSGAPWDQSNAVLQELLDRLGPAAVEQAITLEDPVQKRKISEDLLGVLSLRDPWRALEVFRRHRGEFDPEWGLNLGAPLVAAASEVSGARTVEMMKEFGASQENLIINPAYAEGFDFREVLDYLSTAEKRPFAVPDNLLQAWAERDPAAAAGWMLEHPAGLPRRTDDELNVVDVSRTLAVIAQSGAASRREALGIFARLPDETRQKAVENLGGVSKGVLDPKIADGVAAMGNRGIYLTAVLRETLSTGKLDDSWKAVPPAELRAALARTAEEERHRMPTAVAAKASEHWQRMMEEQILRWRRTEGGNDQNTTEYEKRHLVWHRGPVIHRGLDGRTSARRWRRWIEARSRACGWEGGRGIFQP